MKANKDKGTSVGFSNAVKIAENENEIYPLSDGRNTVCKEHEWVGYLNAKGNYCNKCGIKQPPIDYSKLPPIDFKVNDNLEVINKQQWEDIWDEFRKTSVYAYTLSRDIFPVFWKWLKENYIAPEKK